MRQIARDAFPYYVLRVFSRKELATERDIRALGYETICPYAEGQRRVRGNPRKWKFPLYTGYLFVSWPAWEDGWYRITSSMSSVFGFLGTLHQDDVAYLQSIADGRYDPGEPPPRLRVGDHVVVADGLMRQYLWRLRRIRGKKATIDPIDDKNKYSVEIELAKLDKA